MNVSVTKHQNLDSSFYQTGRI